MSKTAEFTLATLEALIRTRDLANNASTAARIQAVIDRVLATRAK